MTSTSTLLTGSHIHLRTITEADFEPLHRIIQAQPDAYFYSNIGHERPKFTLWFEQALREQAFVVVDNASGRQLGSTRFYSPNPLVPHANLGYTWYDVAVMGTQVNPEAKYLILSHAFETLGLLRVGFEVDAQNMRSRAAMLKLGANLEGILRHHRRRWSDDALSDTCTYSIVLAEWPQVKSQLLGRIGHFAQAVL